MHSVSTNLNLFLFSHTLNAIIFWNCRNIHCNPAIRTGNTSSLTRFGLIKIQLTTFAFTGREVVERTSRAVYYKSGKVQLELTKHTWKIFKNTLGICVVCLVFVSHKSIDISSDTQQIINYGPSVESFWTPKISRIQTLMAKRPWCGLFLRLLSTP